MLTQGSCNMSLPLWVQLVVMETVAARAATQDVLTTHYIAHDRSEELRGGAVQA